MKYTFRWLKVKYYDDLECDQFVDADVPEAIKIGRASCRERV